METLSSGLTKPSNPVGTEGFGWLRLGLPFPGVGWQQIPKTAYPGPSEQNPPGTKVNRISSGYPTQMQLRHGHNPRRVRRLNQVVAPRYISNRQRFCERLCGVPRFCSVGLSGIWYYGMHGERGGWDLVHFSIHPTSCLLLIFVSD